MGRRCQYLKCYSPRVWCRHFIKKNNLLTEYKEITDEELILLKKYTDWFRRNYRNELICKGKSIWPLKSDLKELTPSIDSLTQRIIRRLCGKVSERKNAVKSESSMKQPLFDFDYEESGYQCIEHRLRNRWPEIEFKESDRRCYTKPHLWRRVKHKRNNL